MTDEERHALEHANFENRYQANYALQRAEVGLPLDLSGPVRHKPPKAAVRRWPSVAQVLAQIGKAQSRIARLYIEPNPFTNREETRA